MAQLAELHVVIRLDLSPAYTNYRCIVAFIRRWLLTSHDLSVLARKAQDRLCYSGSIGTNTIGQSEHLVLFGLAS